MLVIIKAQDDCIAITTLLRTFVWKLYRNGLLDVYVVQFRESL